MDKSYHSSGGGGGGGGESSGVTTSSGGGGSSSNSSSRDVFLKQLNKISHKISKPIIRRPGAVIESHLQNQGHSNQNQVQANNQPQPQNLQQQQQQHQPPVYNINKSDFRDVVQRLTGSPAHERDRLSSPAPPSSQQQHQALPRPSSSRLQRIRPPPLAQISNRPPNLMNCAGPVPPQPHNTMGAVSSGGFLGGQRQPLSPLPPFPTVHAAAESPISAYMRFLQNSVASTEADSKKFPSPAPLSPLAPRWNNVAPTPLPPPCMQQQNIRPLAPPQHQQLQNVPPPPGTSSAALLHFPALPTSPLPFGCLPSPGLLSPSMMFSPTGLGFQQLPLSPTLQVPSPKWKGV